MVFVTVLRQDMVYVKMVLAVFCAIRSFVSLFSVPFDGFAGNLLGRLSIRMFRILFY